VTRSASPVNANERLIRLCELLLLFSRSKHGLTVAEVRAAAGISRSTFFRDLKVLQDAGVPIEQREGRYRFLNAPEVPPLGLNAEQEAVIFELTPKPAVGGLKWFTVSGKPLPALRVSVDESVERLR
jgi:biotin operon repressor